MYCNGSGNGNDDGNGNGNGYGNGKVRKCNLMQCNVM